MAVAKYPFWCVVPGDRDGEYILPVMPPATVGPEGAPHVMGGVAHAAVVDALQLASDQPLLWSHVQFLAPTTHAEELTIRCEQCGGGQAVGQWLAEVRVNGNLTHRASAALGAREPSEQTIFAAMPNVPGPDESEALPTPEWSQPGALFDQFEMRVALQDNDGGRRALWSRSTAEVTPNAGWLAIVSDFFLGSHPASQGGRSLDDLYRFVQAGEPGWVLTYIEFSSFDRGVVHGSAKHYSESGKLLSISSQSGVLPRIPLGI
ncbi:hypothetical protein [Altererythrobacter sp. MF3-039]|uniref:hypothetical protein n=1 Tax=Altererythrobacter sp. MF3-039 TaxID=3252901 RepID=UPI00390C872C